MAKPFLLQVPLAHERAGRDFYRELAERAAFPPVRRMYESFAADEELHVKWIEELMSADAAAVVPGEDADPAGIRGRLKAVFTSLPPAERGKMAAETDDIAAIDRAVGREEEAIRIYREAAAGAGDETLSRFFSRLAEFESTHRELLVNMGEYLRNTGDWNMAEEEWIFDGG